MIGLKKLLITGYKGQLATELAQLLAGKYEIIGTDRDELDITDRDSTIRLVKEISPSVVINAAAYNDVDKAESQKELVFLINAKGPENIATACEEVKAKFVHLSSDYVFDGKKRTPYIESDITNPLNVYGKSKVEAEKLVSNSCSRHFLLRTAWLYGAFGNNFLKTMLKLSQEKDEVGVVNDQMGTPTYSLDLARTIAHIIETDDYGLYHATNAGECSWYDFAKEIFRVAGKKTQVYPIDTPQSQREALRPAYSVMENRRLEKEHGYFMRSWEEALGELLEWYTL